ncbi:hypothetical protein DXV75_03435 [Alteromonas aestuariivivens]|uniref:Uncharacterized protein n=1 Tax=Alteromonas aestuariivivens TaxID=1938339 RepID=A0A3D8MCA9_9ALTE|nr:hypothetical protein [Alteromonas aestuariivivens]RDV28031.1 hypothetical protein DXV75_03435 [Alteromonas aestuariivivens]
MFRALVIIAEIIVLLLVLRSPFVQYFFADIHNSLSDWLVEMAQLPDKLELESLQKNVAPHFQAMRPFQKQYLSGVMSSRSSINHFHQLYCISGDKNPFIYGASLRYFCSSIEKTKLLD